MIGFSLLTVVGLLGNDVTVAFPVEPLNRLLRRDTEIRRHLKATLSDHLISKLVRISHDLLALRE